MGRFWIVTILDPDRDLYPFLNNGFNSKFDFDSELVSLVLDVKLVLDSVPIGEPRSCFETGST